MTFDGRVDPVTLSISEKFDRMVLLPTEPSIFRVHHEIRKVNTKAYDPGMVSIGPYHRGKAELHAIEDHKLRYLKLLLRRTETSLEPYVLAMREMEERARHCYRDYFCLDSDQFVEMMLLDAAFIVEFSRKTLFREFREDIADPIFQSDKVRYNLRNDMMLLENQLPFFVLNALFEMTKNPGEKKDYITTAIFAFRYRVQGKDISRHVHNVSLEKTKHLLDLIYYMWFPTFAKIDPQRENKEMNMFIRCVTELKEAGVKFKKSGGEGLFEIKFKDGVMEMSMLKVTDSTEILFRNLIAYEQSWTHNHRYYMTDYVKFLDCLINSSRDVSVLRHQGIIDNWLGDDEEISTTINKLCNGISFDPEIFCYAETFESVNKHCLKRRNVWMRKLKHNYFNSPWTLISVLAAVTLLLLTLAQTVFSYLSI